MPDLVNILYLFYTKIQGLSAYNYDAGGVSREIPERLRRHGDGRKERHLESLAPPFGWPAARNKLPFGQAGLRRTGTPGLRLRGEDRNFVHEHCQFPIGIAPHPMAGYLDSC